jgi:tripartite-type tricarboxylate transporter receptor subunit TctC
MHLCKAFRAVPWRLAAASVAFAAGSSALAAESFPTRPVRMIIVATAGGPADFIGRLFAQHLTELWGQQVVPDNRPGASGVIAVDTVARANPDGYTMLLGSNSNFAIFPLLKKDLPYDIQRDLSTIGLLADAPHVVAVREGLPVKSIKELIALAKQAPGKYSFGSGGSGTIAHMSGELFKHYAGIDIRHIPYKGGAQAAIGVLVGEVDILDNDLSTILVHAKTGKMKVLAAAHTKRLSPLPDVPTFIELGMPNIVSSTWWGFAVPSSTPAAVKAQLAAAYAKVVAKPEYIERLSSLAMERLVVTPAQTTAKIKSETAKWQKIITAADIRID